ncbi:uncharacterized protein AB675_12154 [Cyphellophora attinorum]|uniref:CSC1/OSCA1-like N-terminal transmembrane domain-containing protein n=1 Tax=Cyphellophora attinorum TaxID=1664694 RepID=A0A0N0NKQ5_9EURO|nr:uncharacterized protein AB675_12154 [Phialophora attinorum]KPI38308.1 hypothetical protein AB675_12154 [Phialophora attinorum]
MEALNVLHHVKRQAPSANADDDQNVGSANQTSPSLSGLVSTLVPALLIFVVWMIAFTILRRKFPRRYAPRTYLNSLREQERTPNPPNSLFGWLPFMQKIPDEFVLQHNSLDGYFLLRYIKISIVITFVGCLITWPTLFPINITGGAGQKQLNILTFSNISADTQVQKLRYLGHVLVMWIYVGFIFFMVTREYIYFISVRQAYLLSPLYASRISSRTVLFQSVPTEYANEHKIRRMFGQELKNVWVASDTKKLEEMTKDRSKAAMKLEGAETKLIRLANTARIKASKKGGQQPPPQAADDREGGAESGAAAARWVPSKKRPTHRLKPIIGKKVDTINWARDEIARLNPLIEQAQNIYRAGEQRRETLYSWSSTTRHRLKLLSRWSHITKLCIWLLVKSA